MEGELTKCTVKSIPVINRLLLSHFYSFVTVKITIIFYSGLGFVDNESNH